MVTSTPADNRRKAKTAFTSGVQRHLVRFVLESESGFSEKMQVRGVVDNQ